MPADGLFVDPALPVLAAAGAVGQAQGVVRPVIRAHPSAYESGRIALRQVKGCASRLTADFGGSSVEYRDTVLSTKTIDQAGRRLAEVAAAPARVFVFGSHARGDVHEDSDLDFLVVESGDQPPTAKEIMRLRDALPPLGVPVDVIVMNEDLVRRRKDVPGSLVYRALREGRLVAES